MELRSLCIIYADAEGILLNLYAKPAALNNRLILCIRKLSLCRFYSAAFCSQKMIRSGFPRRHNKAVRSLIPISVKARTNTKNIVCQKP